MDTAEEETATGQLSPTLSLSGANKARTEKVTLHSKWVIMHPKDYTLKFLSSLSQTIKDWCEFFQSI